MLCNSSKIKSTPGNVFKAWIANNNNNNNNSSISRNSSKGRASRPLPLNNSPRHLQLKPLRQEQMANNNNKQLEEGEEASEPKEAEEEVSEEVLEVVSGEETEEPITTIAKQTAPV